MPGGKHLGFFVLLWRETRGLCFLLLCYHYGLHRLGLFSFDLYVISCIWGAVLCVFVQDCQNGGEFARHHLMYLRLRLAFENNNNYHPISSSSSQSSSINSFFFIYTPLGLVLSATHLFWFAFARFGRALVPLWPGGDSIGQVDKVYR